jgi:hypothetical protein
VLLLLGDLSFPTIIRLFCNGADWRKRMLQILLDFSRPGGEFTYVKQLVRQCFDTLVIKLTYF